MIFSYRLHLCVAVCSTLNGTNADISHNVVAHSLVARTQAVTLLINQKQSQRSTHPAVSGLHGRNFSPPFFA